ncbi:hypothetical protein HID58_051997 [Brassica napus]|uniref:Uncharacterized protein n=1 Tax=Brassica napus TaxID=3708 RepID=A0ABQ8ABE2_BRANA|nr:hypothetical protein HID58_051997 [Brassica napus]
MALVINVANLFSSKDITKIAEMNQPLPAKVCNNIHCKPLTKDLLPISQMSPFLLKYSGHIEAVDGRIKGVAHNAKLVDSGLMVALLIQTLAMFGPETCTCITPFDIHEEAQMAVVMMYEFHRKL